VGACSIHRRQAAVGTTLLLLTYDHTIARAFAAAVIILCREIWCRPAEFLAELNVRVHVTQLAKWKTTMQMIDSACCRREPAGDELVRA